MLRTILGLVAGVVVMFGVIMGTEYLGHQLYPPPPGLDPMNPAHEQAFLQFIATMPVGAKAILVAAWTLGAFAGGYIAAKIAAHPRAVAVIVALVVVSGVVAMLVKFPHPSWVGALGLLLPIPAALFAARLAKPRAIPKS